MPNVQFEDGVSIDFEGQPTQQDIDEAHTHALSLKKPELRPFYPKIGTEAGGTTPEDIALSTVQGTAQDIAAPVYHFVNQLGMNYPRYLTEKAGVKYPEDTTSPVAGVIAKGAGVLGALKNPILKGIGPEFNATRNAVVGGLAGGAYASDLKDKPAQVAMGAALPVGIEALSQVGKLVPKALKGTANSLIESAVKRFPKYARHGAIPAEAITKEGVTGNSVEDLTKNLTAKLNEIGQQKGAILNSPENAGKTIDASGILNPIDEAIQEASKYPDRNKTLLSKLQGENGNGGLRSDIVSRLGTRDLSNLPVGEADILKQELGKLRKWTGEVSDDEVINKAITKSYGNLMGGIEKVVPEVGPTNQRWQNVLTALQALQNKDLFSGKEGQILNIGRSAGIWAGLGGLFTGNLPLAAGGFAEHLLAKAAGSPMVKTNLARGMYKAGEGLEGAGNKTNNLITNLLNKIRGTSQKNLLVGKSLSPITPKVQSLPSPASRPMITYKGQESPLQLTGPAEGQGWTSSPSMGPEESVIDRPFWGARKSKPVPQGPLKLSEMSKKVRDTLKRRRANLKENK